MIGSGYPPSACAGVRVPVTASAATPRKTIAPAGTGRTIEPTMVPRKIARSRQDLALMPSGTGIRRILETTAATVPHRTSSSRLVSVSAVACGLRGGGSGRGRDSGDRSLRRRGSCHRGPNMLRPHQRGQSRLIGSASAPQPAPTERGSPGGPDDQKPTTHNRLPRARPDLTRYPGEFSLLGRGSLVLGYPLVRSRSRATLHAVGVSTRQVKSRPVFPSRRPEWMNAN